jgi:hypothetical protein
MHSDLMRGNDFSSRKKWEKSEAFPLPRVPGAIWFPLRAPPRPDWWTNAQETLNDFKVEPSYAI